MSKILKPKEMAEKLGVTVLTLQRWDNKGILKAYRTPTNRRYYTEEQYLQYIGKSKHIELPNFNDMEQIELHKIESANKAELIDDLNILNKLALDRRVALKGGEISDTNRNSETISKSDNEKTSR